MTVFQIPFGTDVPVGQQTFTTPGTTSFTVPEEVFYISAICIGGGGSGARGQNGREQAGAGGGGLRWIRGLPVTPGETLTVVVGAGGAAVATNNVNGNNGNPSSIARGATVLIQANGGTASTYVNGANTGGGGGGGSFDASVIGVAGITTGGGNGGKGGDSSAALNAGGGGAGGYSGNGGPGVNDGATFSAGTNGGSGGGGAGGEDGANDGVCGGGVGLLGEGESGATSGAGGSGGANGTSGTGSSGGLYGGGGGGAEAATQGGGGGGAVRIVWGPARGYPNTNYGSEISLAETATSSAATITIPATAQAGDVAFLFNGSSTASSPPTTVVPSGWTSISNTSVTSTVACRGICSYKILTSGDPGTIITGMDSTEDRLMLLVFRSNFSVSSLTLSTPTNEGTINDPTAQTISLSSITTPVKPTVGLSHMFARTGSITGITITGDTMTQISNTTNQYVQYILNNFSDTTLNDVTVDFADSGSNILQSFYATFEGLYV